MANVSNHFKMALLTYLGQRAASDSFFAESYHKSHKNIEDCMTYILNAVKQSGYNGFADKEIYSMAVHYYDEDNIDIGKPMNCNIVVNHVVELTKEEKEQARKDAIQRVHNEAYNRLKYSQKRTNTQVQEQQPSLFD